MEVLVKLWKGLQRFGSIGKAVEGTMKVWKYW